MDRTLELVDLTARLRRVEDVERAYAAAPVRFVSAELLALLEDPFAGESPLTARTRHLRAV